jgi:hypothetical protein
VLPKGVLRGLLLCLCVYTVLEFGSPAAQPRTTAQNEPPPPQRLNIVGINDTEYPTLNIFVSVIDSDTAAPVTSLLAADFTVTITDNNDDAAAPLVPPVTSLDTDTNANRPQHTMLLLDLTSTISEIEFINMRTAAIEYINSLSLNDQVGVLGIFADRTTLLQPISIDHNAAINAMFAAEATPVQGEDGNVVTDGLYEALDNLNQTRPDVRPAVVMFTDVASGSIGGERTFEEVQTLAEQRGAELYILYFETENSDGLPIRDAPPELLTELALQTGGLLLQAPGEPNPEEPTDFNDDANLPALAQQVAAILGFEYRLEVASPIVGDNEIYGLQLTAFLNDNQLGPQETFFRARTGIVDIAFSPFESGARVTLPIDLQIRVLSASNPITSIEIFRIDNNTGEEIPLATFASPDEALSLTSEPVASGALSLVARATDEGGNVGEAFLTLVIENPNATPIPTATWTPPPTTTPMPVTATQTASPSLPPTETATVLPVQLSPTVSATLPAPIAPPATPQPPDSTDDTSLIIPIIVALVGMFGTLLIGFSLLALAQRRNKPAATTASERPTIPRKPSSNAPTENIATAELQPTIQSEPTPSKDIWKKAMENLDTQAAAAIDPAAVPRAVLLSGDNQRYELVEGENTVGRHSSNMVQILDATVSRYHAVIEVFGDNISIMDWQASHPTTVNGEVVQIGERKRLQTGDQIQMGNTVLRLVTSN